MSILFRAPRAGARQGLVLIGVISTTLLVGGSAMPSGAQSPRELRRDASAVAVGEGRAQGTTPVGGHSFTTTNGSPAQFRLKEERDRLALRLTEQLVHLQSVFANATPGSPAQFRSHEGAESLREQVRSITRG
jgi:hypothetical protein